MQAQVDSGDANLTVDIAGSLRPGMRTSLLMRALHSVVSDNDKCVQSINNIIFSLSRLLT